MKRFQTALAMTLLLATPALAQADFTKALSDYKQGKYQEAITAFEQIVADNPDYEDGFRILGDSYLKTRQFERAAEAFQNALRLKDDFYPTYFALGTAYYNARRYEDAVATLLKGERFAPANPAEKRKIYSIRGAAYFNSGKYAEAISDLEKAQSIQRGRPNEWLQLGLAYFQTGNEARAVQYLDSVLRVEPGNEQALRFSAQLKRRNGVKAIADKNPKKAIELLREVAAVTPGDGETWYNLGLAYQMEEQLSQAENAFSKCVSLLPDKWEAHHRLGYIYEIQKQYAKSLKAYQQAEKLSGNAQAADGVKRVQERIRRQRAGG